MHVKKGWLSQLLLTFILLFMTSLVAQEVIAETTLKDNIEMKGELFIENEAGGITFPDGSRQMTMPKPTWHRTLNYDVRFELVLNDDAVLGRETGLVWQRDTNNTEYNWYEAQAYCYNVTIGNLKG